MADSALSSEKSASSPSTANRSTAAPAPAPKKRSCTICRSRKVRCDKQSPCSNCRRANIACIYPSTDRPPRWARRMERLNAAAFNSQSTHGADPDAANVMERLRGLENLVKELSGQLQQAQAGDGQDGASPSGTSNSAGSPQSHGTEAVATSSIDTGGVQKQFGRLVLQNASRSRYVNSGFWSQINNELDDLKMDTRSLAIEDSESSEDEASSEKSPPPTKELERTPSERHNFLFGHNLSPSIIDSHEFQPLPSQIPFLLDVFSENVNFFCQVVHMPTVTNMVRNLRGGNMSSLTPSNEALLFAIFYAAITSMEEDDVLNYFGSTKSDLNLKYRRGLEHALAKADFLNAPDLILVQALCTFLALLRRHDSPRFVWMMTGVLIRMAQYLGLQRDGSYFEQLTPFEVEMRRRVWWCVVMLDLRSSEDQGTDLTIANGSFDTKVPLNIDDADISTDTKEIPPERDGLTDVSFARVMVGLCDTTKKLMSSGVKNSVAGLEQQSRMVNEILQRFEEGYLQYITESGNITYWVCVTVARLTMAKMNLILFLPVLFSSPSDQFSEEIRTKLLVSAIEVAEYNHALNSEQACRKWRWIYQTYTQWHAIVYLLTDISRRPWSPIVERAWIALHSSWLIPAKNSMDNKYRNVWVPLRKLMAKARKHRDEEISRLRVDPQAASKLVLEDQKIQMPLSSGPFTSGSVVGLFHERWRQLIAAPAVSEGDRTTSGVPKQSMFETPIQTTHVGQPIAATTSNCPSNYLGPRLSFSPESESHANPQTLATYAQNEYLPVQTAGSSYNEPLPIPKNWPAATDMDFGGTPWLWADADPSADPFSGLDMDFVDVNMDLDNDTNWYNWMESATGIELALD
ncbi:hypothetical protein EJ08DRAFT_584213 [Tothia fuscella]|uniref:Zn(2)-C6 fungal-type domain-containing protein n=1 Tax=Tothia fuscella TaxID=1048955 RepID=A0A9P4NWW9_9PEZI|nr:hypothetical protein EJ08DRAFT_584213 [Tothia fuscella]